MAMPMPGGRLQIGGDRMSGQDVRTQNVTAVTAIANIVKTSLGPVGLDKVRPGAAIARDRWPARAAVSRTRTAPPVLSSCVRAGSDFHAVCTCCM
jgi:hypothetical protein